MVQEKTIVVLGMICALTGLQLFAWASGHDGTVFAFCSSTIASIVFAFLGFEYGYKKGGE